MGRPLEGSSMVGTRFPINFPGWQQCTPQTRSCVAVPLYLTRTSSLPVIVYFSKHRRFRKKRKFIFSQRTRCNADPLGAGNARLDQERWCYLLPFTRRTSSKVHEPHRLRWLWHSNDHRFTEDTVWTDGAADLPSSSQYRLCWQLCTDFWMVSCPISVDQVEVYAVDFSGVDSTKVNMQRWRHFCKKQRSKWNETMTALSKLNDWCGSTHNQWFAATKATSMLVKWVSQLIYALVVTWLLVSGWFWWAVVHRDRSQSIRTVRRCFFRRRLWAEVSRNLCKT